MSDNKELHSTKLIWEDATFKIVEWAYDNENVYFLEILTMNKMGYVSWQEYRNGDGLSWAFIYFNE